MKKSTEKYIKELLENKYLQDQYMEIYEDFESPLNEVFAYFQSTFNRLFEFMNNKSQTNRNFNASESRELLILITKFEEFNYILKTQGEEILTETTYLNHIESAKTFVVPSNGSEIPEGYSKLHIIKFEPIFTLNNRRIGIARNNEKYELKMIGEGAFSNVYSYKDEFLNKKFAVKKAKKAFPQRNYCDLKKSLSFLKD